MTTNEPSAAVESIRAEAAAKAAEKAAAAAPKQDKPKRKRRTKAEIEADKARAEAEARLAQHRASQETRDAELSILTLAFTATGALLCQHFDLSPWGEEQGRALAEAWQPVLAMYAGQGPWATALVTTGVVLAPYAIEYAQNRSGPLPTGRDVSEHVRTADGRPEPAAAGIRPTDGEARP